MNASLTALMEAADTGSVAATEALFEALYAELHQLARRELARSGPGSRLGATSLLHEAYLDMSRREGIAFPDRARFMGYAARVMRGVIIDYTRRRQARKRGSEFEITSLDGKEVGGADPGAPDADDLLLLSQALEELAKVESDLAQVVDLKYFCGFTFAEIATLRGASERTIQRQWDKARLYLRSSLREGAMP